MIVDDFKIKWRYIRFPISFFVKGKLTSRKTVETQCIIENKHSAIVGRGICRLHQDDVFTKEEGRKESLKRALSDFTGLQIFMVNDTEKESQFLITKSFRTRVWTEYFNRKKKNG